MARKMDPSLVRELGNFKRHAMSIPVVEAKKRKEDKKHKAKPSSKSKEPSTPNVSTFDYKTASGASQTRFAALAKIVRHMKKRHLEGITNPLTVDEILDETNLTDLSQSNKYWLQTEALPSNPKIEMKDGDQYLFKPVYHLYNRNNLVKLLQRSEQEATGGVLWDDVEESLPRADKALKLLEKEMIPIQRLSDKKTVVFYRDRTLEMELSGEQALLKHWRCGNSEGMDDLKIEKHLSKLGVATQTMAIRIEPRKRKAVKKGKRGKLTKTHNEHITVLQDFSQD